MLDLRDYKDLVKETLKEVSEDDKNWKWRIQSCEKNEILIGWGYFLNEEKYFVIELEEVDDIESGEPCNYWLWARSPFAGIIGDWDIELDGKATDGRFGSPSIEAALKSAAKRIVRHALNVY